MLRRCGHIASGCRGRPRYPSVMSEFELSGPAAALSVERAPADPAPTRVLRQFRQVFNAVRSHFQQVEKTAGIGGAQLWALSVIGERDGLAVSELARALDIHQSTASNLVRALTERALVEAVRHGPDRRVVQLRLLPAGREILQRAPGPFSGVLPAALARLDPATLARLEEDLAVLIETLDADSAGAGLPLGL